MNFEPIKFTHLFPSGRIASITVQRREDQMPEITGEGWPKLHEADWADYTVWRTSVIRPIMEDLTMGELAACALYGQQKMRDDHKRRYGR